ncbi:MAG: alpha/beta hydrolase [Solirubrobacteraceae bacterium]
MRANGNPVLLLHGQPGGAADWDAVIADLGDGFAAIAADRPGWDGHSRAQDLAGNGIAALATLEAHDAQRATVVGHSLGAAIAAWLGVHYPERVSALVLCAPAANTAALYPAERWLAAPVAAELTSATTMGGLGMALSVPGLAPRLAKRVGIDPGYVSTARRKLLEPAAWRAYAAEQRYLIRDLPALEARLGAIAAPTTILTGTGDRVVPPKAPRRLAEQIPDAHLVACPGAGHLLPQRHPQMVADAIRHVLS